MLKNYLQVYDLQVLNGISAISVIGCLKEQIKHLCLTWDNVAEPTAVRVIVQEHGAIAVLFYSK